MNLPGICMLMSASVSPLRFWPKKLITSIQYVYFCQTAHCGTFWNYEITQEKTKKKHKNPCGHRSHIKLAATGTEARKSWETKSCSTKKNTKIDFRSARKLLKNLGKSRDMPLISRWGRETIQSDSVCAVSKLSRAPKNDCKCELRTLAGCITTRTQQKQMEAEEVSTKPICRNTDTFGLARCIVHCGTNLTKYTCASKVASTRRRCQTTSHCAAITPAKHCIWK